MTPVDLRESNFPVPLLGRLRQAVLAGHDFATAVAAIRCHCLAVFGKQCWNVANHCFLGDFEAVAHNPELEI